MAQPNPNLSSLRAALAPRALVLLWLSLVPLAVAGCGSGIHDPNFNPNGNSGGTTPTAPVNYANNWEMTTVATTKGANGPLTKLTGSIIADATSGAPTGSITPVFRATSPCYVDATSVPMNGTLSGTAFSARSFDVKGQFLTLMAQENFTATQMTGTYSIGGGCSNGEAGTLTGTRFQVLTGTFAGSFNDGGTTHAVSLTIAQNTAPTGDGTFLITGKGSMTNFSCFASGTIPDGGATVSGGDVSMTLNMSAPAGITALFTGRLSTDAQTLTVNSLAITGQGCTGSYTGLVLKKQ